MFGCLASTTALTTKATTNSLTSLLKNQNPFSINNFSPINEDSLVIVFFYFVSGDSSILEKTHTNCRGKPSKTFKRKSPKETQRTCSEECKKNPLTSRKHSFSLRIFHIFPTSFHQFISQKRQSQSDVNTYYGSASCRWFFCAKDKESSSIPTKNRSMLNVGQCDEINFEDGISTDQSCQKSL